MISNILTITKLDNEGVSLTFDWCSMEELVGSALSRLNKQGHRIETRLVAELPLVRGDARLLEQLIQNVAENFPKYTPQGCKLEIRAQVAFERLRLEFADDGPGIAPEDWERIFTRFYRVQAVVDRGVGLGLAICRAIVTSHGGSIWCERSELGGAKFVVELPLPDQQPTIEDESL